MSDEPKDPPPPITIPVGPFATTERKPAEPIPLRPSPPSEIKIQVVRKAPICFHDYTEVDDGNRTVTCKSCAAVLDPFKVLLNLANNWKHLAYDVTASKRETAAVEARLKLLKRLEDNARARVRKLGHNTDKYRLEWLVDYAAKSNPALSREEIIERAKYLSNEQKLTAAAKALQDGDPHAAVALGHNVIEELEAALTAEVVTLNEAAEPARRSKKHGSRVGK